MVSLQAARKHSDDIRFHRLLHGCASMSPLPGAPCLNPHNNPGSPNSSESPDTKCPNLLALEKLTSEFRTTTRGVTENLPVELLTGKAS